MATSTEFRKVAKQLADLTVYYAIGLDSKGRSHHYDADAGQIVVCSSDRRGKGIRGSDDIEQRIDPPEWSTGAWDYIAFVRNEVEDVSWVETDAPEQAPEEN